MCWRAHEEAQKRDKHAFARNINFFCKKHLLIICYWILFQEIINIGMIQGGKRGKKVVGSLRSWAIRCSTILLNGYCIGLLSPPKRFACWRCRTFLCNSHSVTVRKGGRSESLNAWSMWTHWFQCFQMDKMFKVRRSRTLWPKKTASNLPTRYFPCQQRISRWIQIAGWCGPNFFVGRLGIERLTSEGTLAPRYSGRWSDFDMSHGRHDYNFPSTGSEASAPATWFGCIAGPSRADSGLAHFKNFFEPHQIRRLGPQIWAMPKLGLREETVFFVLHEGWLLFTWYTIVVDSYDFLIFYYGAADYCMGFNIIPACVDTNSIGRFSVCKLSNLKGPLARMGKTK